MECWSTGKSGPTQLLQYSNYPVFFLDRGPKGSG